MTGGAARWREPWVVREDGETIVVRKPAGVNVRRTGRHGQDGIVEWVQRQRPGRDLSVVVEPEDRAPSSTPFAGAARERTMLLDPSDTNAYLWIDRHHDGFPGVRVERLGSVVLVLDYRERQPEADADHIDDLLAVDGIDTVFLQERPRAGGATTARRLAGPSPPQFDVLELGLRYRIDLDASATSSGLFLDQRETRRELLSTSMAGKTVLNTFAHTGAFSVAAAVAGAETLTLDLSKHYLDWARENFRRNRLDPDDHDFIYGDALDWMGRLAKRGRRFDLVIADPPTASTARKGSKRWTVGRDLHQLVARAAELAAPGGQVYVSTNFRKMRWSSFLDHVDRGIDAARRRGRVDTRTVPLDHRTDAGDPPYLKAAWVQLDP